ncbi:MAG: hypothetical protein PVH68_06310 [Armatimonadota bacterium]|jgi:succinate dehydrogenase / fumarate reductase membrane anchor subunit
MRETRFWTWHLIAGAVVLVFLGLHMLIMHLDGIVGFMNPDGAESVEWENVRHRAQFLFFTVTYIVLLGAALYHGLYGTRILLFELNLKPALQQLVTIGLWAVGLVLFGLGAVANVLIHMNRISA